MSAQYIVSSADAQHGANAGAHSAVHHHRGRPSGFDLLHFLFLSILSSNTMLKIGVKLPLSTGSKFSAKVKLFS
jgi:hypothetical protein